MNILITGALGFVGRYAVRECRDAGHTVYQHDIEVAEGVHSCDLRDSAATDALIEELRPDACIHLAGITFIPAGWHDPASMYNANLMGTLNLLEAFRSHSPTARILSISSSQVYDAVRVYDDFGEKVHFQATNIYAISKLAADLTVLSYTAKYGMNAFIARPINHVGPGQSSSFVVSAFARQLKRMSQGRQDKVMKVGNLESRRDFLDVRDVVRAYRLLIEKGRAGESYDIATGKLTKIKKVLKKLSEIAGVDPEIEVDSELYRPTDSSPRINSVKVRKVTGWTPEIDIEKTLNDIYAAAEG